MWTTRRADPLVSGDMIPGTQYRVLRQLGSGGMSSVYEVLHVKLGRRFVLKVLLPELVSRQDLVERVRNEWRALGRLKHPNVIGVTDAGLDRQGLPFFVMERLPGETLAELLGRERCLPVRRALEMGADVLSGLHAAHSLGIVHRDVKPANIFVPVRAPVKLLDFGIAKFEDSVSATTTGGASLGTPRYMSPEQVRGERADARSDLYAFGLVLYEMIAGRHPFAHARGAEAACSAQLEATPRALVELVPGVSERLNALVQELLAKQPKQRPKSALRALARLEMLLGHEPRLSLVLPEGRAGSPVVRVVEPLEPKPLASASAVKLVSAETDTVAGIPWTVIGLSAPGRRSMPACASFQTRLRFQRITRAAVPEDRAGARAAARPSARGSLGWRASGSRWVAAIAVLFCLFAGWLALGADGPRVGRVGHSSRPTK